MLTVLIRNQKTKREIILPAKNIEYIPIPTKEETEIVDIDRPGLLINHGVEAEGGCHLAMTSIGDDNFRDVFVMNSHGQTVARYIL